MRSMIYGEVRYEGFNQDFGSKENPAPVIGAFKQDGEFKLYALDRGDSYPFPIDNLFRYLGNFGSYEFLGVFPLNAIDLEP